MIWSGKSRYISFKKLPYNMGTYERVREAVKARVRIIVRNLVLGFELE